MLNKLILPVISILLALFQCAIAATAVNPPAATPAAKPVPHLNATCIPIKNLKSHDKNISLEGVETNPIYLIKNHTKKSIWLDHPVKHIGASAGWASYLKSGDWSALVVDKRDFSLSCSVIAPGKMETLDCAQALSVCHPAHLVYNPHRKGTFWLVEGKNWKDMLKVLQARGVK
jgi:hypothetical protein